MAGRDGNYPNSKVGFEQNNNASATDRLFCDNDGFFNFDDGNDVAGEQLKVQLYDTIQKTTITASATRLSILNLPESVGLLILSLTSNLAQGSFWLTSCVQGRNVIIKLHPGSCASGSVVISTSGCSIVGLGGSDVSVIHLINSANSTALIELRAYQDNEWTVINLNTALNVTL